MFDMHRKTYVPGLSGNNYIYNFFSKTQAFWPTFKTRTPGPRITWISELKPAWSTGLLSEQPVLHRQTLPLKNRNENNKKNQPNKLY